MYTIDPGHIYAIPLPRALEQQHLTFVKRGGGAIRYSKEWPGIQTQAVMRAIITHLELISQLPTIMQEFALWQLGSNRSAPLRLGGSDHVAILIDVLIDRSQYLDAILPCTETGDAVAWLWMARSALLEPEPDCLDAKDSVSLALWCYEVRAYRRKQEKVNRLHPAHADDVRPKPWRELPFSDIPFSAEAIHLRPIGEDGHIVLS